MDQLRLHGTKGDVDRLQVHFLCHGAQPLKALQHIGRSLSHPVIVIHPDRQQLRALRDPGDALLIPGGSNDPCEMRPMEVMV